MIAGPRIPQMTRMFDAHILVEAPWTRQQS